MTLNHSSTECTRYLQCCAFRGSRRRRNSHTLISYLIHHHSFLKRYQVVVVIGIAGRFKYERSLAFRGGRHKVRVDALAGITMGPVHLSSLRGKGFISWKSGGLANKKGKNGRTLSNDYKLNLSSSNSKIEQISPNPSVRQSDTPVYNCRTLQCPALGHQQK